MTILVFSDLDGTLLDHYDYRWHAAQPALDTLRARAIPLILVSSKTLAELAWYRQALAIDHPVVAENGAVIDIPAGYFDRPVETPASPFDRASIQSIYRKEKTASDYACDAFFELGIDGIVAETGLSPDQAALANTRLASEPIRWRDSLERRERFVSAMQAAGLHCVMGGRFLHLMPATDKGLAVTALTAAYRQQMPDRVVTSVALGDGPNDLGMLAATDIAVVIPGQHSHPMPIASGNHVIRAEAPGPTGWNTAMLAILAARPDNPSTTNRRGE